MKKIAFVPAGISGPHPCVSRSTSRAFALSHSCPSLPMINTANSDGINVSLLMTSPAKYNQDGIYVLGMGNWES